MQGPGCGDQGLFSLLGAGAKHTAPRLGVGANALRPSLGWRQAHYALVRDGADFTDPQSEQLPKLLPKLSPGSLGTQSPGSPVMGLDAAAAIPKIIKDLPHAYIVLPNTNPYDIERHGHCDIKEDGWQCASAGVDNLEHWPQKDPQVQG